MGGAVLLALAALSALSALSTLPVLSTLTVLSTLPVAFEELSEAAEAGLAGLWAHELRWARTLRLLNPAGYAGMALTHPVAWAVLGLVVAPGALSLGVAGLAFAARFAACAWVDRALGVAPRLGWVVPRDGLSFAIWLAGLWPGRVRWGGERFQISRDGRMRRD